MTALFLQWTRDGVVLASDGRSSDEQTGEIKSDTVQKIFQIGGPGRRLAYAMTGALKLGAPGEQAASLDLALEVRRAVESFSKTKTKNLVTYVSKLAETVARAVQDANKSGRIEKLPILPQPERQNESGHTILRMIVAGYCDGVPDFVEARIFHENGVIRAPQVRRQELELAWMSGVPEVSRQLFDESDPRFQTYRPSVPKDRPATLPEVIEMAGQYITACGSPEARAINPTVSRGIGGRTVIATISPTEGFQWVKGFEPNP
jgi:hypothetical protein